MPQLCLDKWFDIPPLVIPTAGRNNISVKTVQLTLLDFGLRFEVSYKVIR